MGFIHRAARIGGILTLSSLGVFLAGEGVARAFELAPPPRGDSKILRVVTGRASEAQAPGVGRVLKPGTEESHVYVDRRGLERRVTYRINSVGIRDREVGREKPEGLFRVCAVGDSFTFGTAIEVEETWPKALERALRRDLATPDVEVLNCGLEALNLPQQAALLANRIVHLEPDLVVLCVYINDASGRGIQPPELPVRLRSRMEWVSKLGLTSGVWAAGEELNAAQRRMMSLRRSSHLADFCAHRLYRALYGSVKEESYRRDWSPGSEGHEAARAALRRIRDLARDEGFPVHVVMYPVICDLGADYPYRAEHGVVGGMCAELGLAFTDLLEALVGRHRSELQAHEHDAHPNGTANELVASYLAPELLPSIALASAAAGPDRLHPTARAAGRER